jgi:hypothetical protein
MYPNPVSNELTIEAKNTIQKWRCLIYWDNRFYLLTLRQIQQKSKQVHLVKVFMLLQPLLMMFSSSKFIKQ